MTPDTRRTVEAAAERILPADEWPGASDAYVIGYVEWLTAHPSFAGGQQSFARGLALLDSLGEGMFGRRFADCSCEQQDGVLHRLQSIPHPTAQRFMEMLVNITLAGYFCDPKYGGNRDRVVWRHLEPCADAAAGFGGR